MDANHGSIETHAAAAGDGRESITHVQVTRARARVYHHVPEFASHEWNDDYFDNHAQRASIVVVFDHDSSLWVKDVAIGLAMFPTLLSVVVYWWLWLGVLPVRFVDLQWKSLLMIVVGTLGTFLGGLFCYTRAIIPALEARMPPAPHTAVTTRGILHTTGGGFWSHRGEYGL